MKKTSINILCILIILLITGSVVSPMLYLGEMFLAGVKDGYEQKTAIDNGRLSENEAYHPYEYNMVDLNFKPEMSTLMHSTDSITLNNGDRFQIIQSRSVMVVPKDKWEGDFNWCLNILYLACLVLYVLLLVQFIRFIVNINRGNIFDSKNVTRLRRFAWYLISISALKCIAGMIEDHMLSKLSLQLKGYTLSAYWEIPWDTMLLGLLALLMAQVWSYGLQLKEDQSLTI